MRDSRLDSESRVNRARPDTRSGSSSSSMSAPLGSTDLLEMARLTVTASPAVTRRGSTVRRLAMRNRARCTTTAATAGTARHALVADDQMRPMFAYLRTMTAPTSLFAAPEDWSDPALNARIDRAAVELVLLMESGFAGQIKDESWQSYQHEFGSAGGTETAIDLDTDMMRLATGGSAS